MAKKITAATLFSKHVSRKDRVLLINPPVEETRYSWIRWNQPLDLLKLGSYLRSRIECEVELFDFMKPDPKGHVHEEWLPRDRRYYIVNGERYPIRRFGQPYNKLVDWVTSRRKENSSGEPTQVWITSLCSYWYESVAEVCRLVRETLPDAQIVLLGQYPRLLPKHACEWSAADLVISEGLDLAEEESAFHLYGKDRPPFLALRLNPRVAVPEIETAVPQGILDFTFFEDDLCRADG
jgi:hypothetical protein